MSCRCCCRHACFALGLSKRPYFSTKKLFPSKQQSLRVENRAIISAIYALFSTSIADCRLFFLELMWSKLSNLHSIDYCPAALFCNLVLHTSINAPYSLNDNQLTIKY